MTTMTQETRTDQDRPLVDESRRSRRPGFHGLLLSPGIALLALLSLAPFVVLVAMSFAQVHLLGGFALEWQGLENWGRFFTDADLARSWVLAAVYFVLTVGLEMVLGVGLAVCLHQLIRGRNALLGLLLLPMFVAPVIVGLLGRFLTDSTFGLYDWALSFVGYDGTLLGGQVSAFVAVVLMDVWEWTPLVMLIALAGLATVPAAVREAAAIDGAGAWQTFRHVVLPSISGVLLVALLIRSMDAIRYFDIIQATTNGGPADATKTVPLRLFETAFRYFDIGYAAVIGLAMLACSIVIARAFVGILDRRGLTR